MPGARRKTVILVPFLAVVLVIVGFWMYLKGPIPHLDVLSIKTSNDYHITSSDWSYERLECPMKPQNPDLLLGTNTSVTLSVENESEVQIYLMNRTQFEAWNQSISTEFVYGCNETSDCNFSIYQKPNEKYFVILNNVISTENVTVTTVVIMQIDIILYDYENVYPGMCLVCVGLFMVNFGVVMLNKQGAFNKLESMSLRMSKPIISLPLRDFHIYAKERGSSTTRSMSIFKYIILYFPPFATMANAARMFTSSLLFTKFTSVLMDYIFTSSLLVYFTAVMLSVCMCSFNLLVSPRIEDISLLASWRLGHFKNVDIRKYREVSKKFYELYRKRVLLLLLPLALLPLLTHAFSESLLEFRPIVPVILVYFSYSGSFLGFLFSTSIYQVFKRPQSAQVLRFRNRSLVNSTFRAFFQLVPFMFLIVSLVVVFVSSLWLPVMGSSMVFHYGFLERSGDITWLANLFFNVGIISSLLAIFVVYAIAFYLVPTLLERGVKALVTAAIILVLSFMTERTLSYLVEPYFRAEIGSAIISSFFVFFIAFCFSKLYERTLSGST